jgi:hypothetical protein
MGVQVPEVTVTVLLEEVAIDDNRRARLPLPPFQLLRLVVRVRIVDHQHEALSVW